MISERPEIPGPVSPLRQRVRGRGAGLNETPRYERYSYENQSDGWDMATPARDLPLLRTETRTEIARTAITLVHSPDLPFDRSLNPYRGCEHGCVYCYARPGHAWLGLSPGLDFETRLIARPNLPEVLERELRKPDYQAAPLAIGTFTDPYQPIEKEYEIMRDVLHTLSKFNHPVAIITKGSLIERDLDILAPMAKKNLVRVGISVTTLDRKLARRMEPRVPPPQRRLQTIRNLSDAGIEVRAMVSPVVPGLTDPELESILENCRDAGAKAASWIMLRLPLEVSQLFQDWLRTYYPDRVNKVMSRLREMHGGKEYSSAWHKRMRGEGVCAELIAKRFALAAKRLGLQEAVAELRSDLFRPPARKGDQLNLL